MRLSWVWLAAALILVRLPAFGCSCVSRSFGCAAAPPTGTIVIATVSAKEVTVRRPPPMRGDVPLDGNRRLTRASRASGAAEEPEPWGHVRVTLRISEVLDGKAGDSLVVRTEDQEESCGYAFEVGHEYLVFVDGAPDNLTVSSCSATRPSKMAVAMIRRLRSLRDGTALPVLWGAATTHPSGMVRRGWEEIRPASGVLVQARAVGKGQEYVSRTAEDGSYEFPGLPTGRYRLSMEAGPGRIALLEGKAATAPVDLWQGNTCPINIVVYFDGRLGGTVVRSDGEPVSGVMYVSSAEPEALAPALTTRVTNGTFEFLRLPPGRYHVSFIPAGPPRLQDAVYYPGTELKSQAAVIELGEGTHIDGLRLTLP